MRQSLHLAPLSEIARYLAIFRRALAFIAGSADRIRQDPHKILLGGHLADALHNVPSLLWHYDGQGHRSPARMDAWITEILPAGLQEDGAPRELVAACRQIVSVNGDAAAEELGLRPDLSDIDLAPAPALEHYLDMLY